MSSAVEKEVDFQSRPSGGAGTSGVRCRYQCRAVEGALGWVEGEEGECLACGRGKVGDCSPDQ